MLGIWDSVSQGDVEAVKLWFMKGGSIDIRYKIEEYNGFDFEGSTLLHFAAFFGKKEVLEFLVGKGAEINVENCFLMVFIIFKYFLSHNSFAIFD